MSSMQDDVQSSNREDMIPGSTSCPLPQDTGLSSTTQYTQSGSAFENTTLASHTHVPEQYSFTFPESATSVRILDHDRMIISTLNGTVLVYAISCVDPSHCENQNFVTSPTTKPIPLINMTYHNKENTHEVNTPSKPMPVLGIEYCPRNCDNSCYKKSFLIAFQTPERILLCELFVPAEGTFDISEDDTEPSQLKDLDGSRSVASSWGEATRKDMGSDANVPKDRFAILAVIPCEESARYCNQTVSPSMSTLQLSHDGMWLIFSHVVDGAGFCAPTTTRDASGAVLVADIYDLALVARDVHDFLVTMPCSTVHTKSTQRDGNSICLLDMNRVGDASSPPATRFLKDVYLRLPSPSTLPRAAEANLSLSIGSAFEVDEVFCDNQTQQLNPSIVGILPASDGAERAPPACATSKHIEDVSSNKVAVWNLPHFVNAYFLSYQHRHPEGEVYGVVVLWLGTTCFTVASLRETLVFSDVWKENLREATQFVHQTMNSEQTQASSLSNNSVLKSLNAKSDDPKKSVKGVGISPPTSGAPPSDGLFSQINEAHASQFGWLPTEGSLEHSCLPQHIPLPNYVFLSAYNTNFEKLVIAMADGVVWVWCTRQCRVLHCLKLPDHRSWIPSPYPLVPCSLNFMLTGECFLSYVKLLPKNVGGSFSLRSNWYVIDVNSGNLTESWKRKPLMTDVVNVPQNVPPLPFGVQHEHRLHETNLKPNLNKNAMLESCEGALSKKSSIIYVGQVIEGVNDGGMYASPHLVLCGTSSGDQRNISSSSTASRNAQGHPLHTTFAPLSQSVNSSRRNGSLQDPLFSGFEDLGYTWWLLHRPRIRPTDGIVFVSRKGTDSSDVLHFLVLHDRMMSSWDLSGKGSLLLESPRTSRFHLTIHTLENVRQLMNHLDSKIQPAPPTFFPISKLDSTLSGSRSGTREMLSGTSTDPKLSRSIKACSSKHRDSNPQRLSRSNIADVDDVCRSSPPDAHTTVSSPGVCLLSVHFHNLHRFASEPTPLRRDLSANLHVFEMDRVKREKRWKDRLALWK